MTAASVSAQVLLRPAGRVEPAGPPSAANLAEHLPSAEDAERVRAWFAGQGFDTGPVVATSFSVSGSPGLFRRTFGTDVELTADPARSGVREVRAAGGSWELALDQLPADVAEPVLAVTFSPPPELHGGAP